MPFCPDCGTKVSEDTQFCPECGRRLAIGQEARGIGKKKIAGIIVGSIIAVIVIAIIARPTPTLPIEEGWVRLKIQDVGSIDYPTDFLELQSGDYRDVVSETSQILGLGKSDFTLQQVGLNELKPSAFDEYRRVILTTEYLKLGEEVFRANEKYTMSKEELAEFQSELIDGLQLGFAATGIELVEFRSIEIKEVNGMYPLVYAYKRQLGDNPIVLVKNCMFFNYNKIHCLAFSYRVQDEEECEDIYAKILYSFRLQ